MIWAILIAAFIGSLLVLSCLSRSELRSFYKHQAAKESWRKMLEN